MTEEDDGITMTLDLSFEVKGPTLDSIIYKTKERLEQFAPRHSWAVKTYVTEDIVARAGDGTVEVWDFSASVGARLLGPLPAGGGS